MPSSPQRECDHSPYGADGKIETVQYHKLTPMLLNEVQRLSQQNAAQAEQLKIEQSKNGAQEAALKAEQAKNQAQAQEIARLKQQMIAVQTQTRRFATLAVRLSRLEARQTAGPVADAR